MENELVTLKLNGVTIGYAVTEEWANYISKVIAEAMNGDVSVTRG